MNRDEICKLAETMCEVLYQKKAEDILSIDIGEKSVVADYFIVCSGRNNIMVKALSDELEFKLKGEGVAPYGISGYDSASWILLDYGSVVVHIFLEDTRAFYSLERLWGDAPRMEIEGIGKR